MTKFQTYCKVIFLIMIFSNGCLRAKKSPFDTSSPTGFLLSFGIISFSVNISFEKENYLFYIGEMVNIEPIAKSSNARFSISPLLPNGLTIDSASGKISGISFLSSPKTKYTIRVTNPLGSAEATMSLRISGTTAFSSIGQTDLTTNTANSGGISNRSLSGPSGIAIDSTNGVYIADSGNNRVLYFPFGSSVATRFYGQLGSFTTGTANNGGVSANSLNSPNGIAIDSANGLYIADYLNNRVIYFPVNSTTATRVYGQLGSFTTDSINNGGLSANSLATPNGVTVDSANGVYISDFANFRVLYYPSGSTTASRVYGQGGNFTSNTPNNGGVTANSLLSTTNVTVDSSGLYISEEGNNRILFYSGTSTTASKVYGQLGSFGTGTLNNGGITANSLNQPYGMNIVSNGIYISDSINHRVLFFSGNSTTATRVYGQIGVFNTNQANKGGISANSLDFPNEVAVNSLGDVYIVDTSNNRILIY